MKNIAVVLALCLAACKGDPVAPPDTPAGSWFGVGALTAISMSLTVEGSSVTGTGTLDGSAVAISGSYQASSSPTAMLTLSANGKSPVTFRVTVLTSSGMGGYLNGGRFTEFAVLLNRR